MHKILSSDKHLCSQEKYLTVDVYPCIQHPVKYGSVDLYGFFWTSYKVHEVHWNFLLEKWIFYTYIHADFQ